MPLNIQPNGRHDVCAVGESARGTCRASHRTQRVGVPDVASLCRAAWCDHRLAARRGAAGRDCLGAGALFDVGRHAGSRDSGHRAVGSRLSADSAEGRFLASVESDGAWFGVSKVPLTLCTSQGKDALITDVPSGVIDVLRLTCSELLVLPVRPQSSDDDDSRRT